MLLITLTVKTLLSISQNGISPITLNKQLGNYLNIDITNASSQVTLRVIYEWMVKGQVDEMTHRGLSYNTFMALVKYST
jgi:hypothetical protein